MLELLLAKYWKYAVLALILAGMTMYVVLLKHKLSNTELKLQQTQTAFDTSVSNYKLAALQATANAAANVNRVKTEQSAITQKVENDYQTQLASSDARFERLRSQAATYLSRPATAQLPDTSNATCLAVAGTDCAELPSILKAAQDNTDKLIALQAWNNQQLLVNVGNDAP